MAKPLKVTHLKANFLNDIESAKKLVERVKGLVNINPRGSDRSLHTKQAYRVVELAFMGIVSEWEEFLEQTFIRYLAGGVCDNGYRAPLKIGRASDMKHSYQLLSKDSSYDPLRNYLKFSDPSWTIAQAEFFFESGDPYSVVREKIQRLREANILRNRVAHSSSKCRNDFKDLAIDYIRPTNNKLSQGYRVANLLLSTAARHFGASARSSDYFEAFCNLYEISAESICPN